MKKRLYDDYVVIIPLNDGNVLLQKQFKPGVGFECFGFPAGFCQMGESPAVCAARELSEETGLKSGSLELLGEYYDNVSVSPAKFSIFLARSVEDVGKYVGNPDEKEGEINNFWVPVTTLFDYPMVGSCMALAQLLLHKKL